MTRRLAVAIAAVTASLCLEGRPTWATKRAAASGCTPDAGPYWCPHHQGWHVAMNHRIQTMQYPTERPPT